MRPAHPHEPRARRVCWSEPGFWGCLPGPDSPCCHQAGSQPPQQVPYWAEAPVTLLTRRLGGWGELVQLLERSLACGQFCLVLTPVTLLTLCSPLLYLPPTPLTLCSPPLPPSDASHPVFPSSLPPSDAPSCTCLRAFAQTLSSARLRLTISDTLPGQAHTSPSQGSLLCISSLNVSLAPCTKHRVHQAQASHQRVLSAHMQESGELSSGSSSSV